MKSAISMLAAASVAVAALSVPAFAADKGYVGIAMPTKGLDRWNKDGASMVQQFEEAGYKTDLQYAENEIPQQLSQVENMITKGVDILVIAAIDGGSLTAPLANAAAAGIPVIAYDRLILNTPNVDYYATFDNYKVGVIQGNSLVEGLKERFPDTKPWNVELFGGSPDDNNAYFFYNGAMSVIQPLIDSGDIVIPSKQMGMDKIGTLNWSNAAAQARMDNLLSAFYTDKTLNGVYASNDDLAMGAISSLKSIGYGSGDMKMPIVTGQDSNLPNVKAIIEGLQYSSIFKDTRKLAGVTVEMVEAINEGKEPEINDTTTYDNGEKVVPSYLLEPVEVTKDNWKQILVDDSGYYTMQQIEN
ncbi:multiple monosaccharide ABC transporter substrate-binding protein [Martelella mediterranea]|uniref:Monosaccharide ABC transporter substrate-binding protein (CUT2 family) n=1 Tax=Martelella mediterranea TaxID=293089 RepID=A0A4R3NS78_9HYPH|nr:multiple monosaccharide ABC transporter substrate-binding protein [Martelella mediterranea]TCT38855.1 monosaccharide ABC transporter substrate-binding protein (CUT2 family) [Martelella mediterranea]